ncbi:unnamed protein product [Aphanomyces euteiches]
MSPMRQRIEPLDGNNEFFQRFGTYESKYVDASEGSAKIEAELDSLLDLFGVLRQERTVSPRSLKAMIELFVKKHFGLQRKDPEDRRLIMHTTLLTMCALSKGLQEDDPEALATLYEFMLDAFPSDGSTRWSGLGPHGSILFAFALCLRRVERTQEGFHSSVVSILKSRQVDAAEFEMDDSLSDILLEKGRRLGGLSFFSSFFTAPSTVQVFDFNAPSWLVSPTNGLPPMQKYVVDKTRQHLLQEAGYTFFSRFVDEFGLVEVQKSHDELLAVVDLFGGLLVDHPALCQTALDDVLRSTESLSLLFPWRFLPLTRLLSYLCTAETVNTLVDLMQQTTFTQITPPEDHYTASGVAVTSTQSVVYDQVTIPAGTSGQLVTIDEQTLICWHVGPYSLWDVMLPCLVQVVPTEETIAVLNLVAAFGRHISLRRFDKDWRRILPNGFDSFVSLLGALLAQNDGVLRVQVAIVSIVAGLDASVVAAAFDPASVLVPAMSAIVSAHHSSGILACLQYWVDLDSIALAPYVSLILQLLSDEIPVSIAAFRLLSRCLSGPLYENVAPTLLEHARALIFDTAITALTLSKGVNPSPTKPVAFDFNRSTPAPGPFLPHSFTEVDNSTLVLVEAALHTVDCLLATPLADRSLLVKWLYQDDEDPASVVALAPFVAHSNDSVNWPMACAAYMTCPSSPAIRLLATRILTSVALTLRSSTLMACFRTLDDTTAFLKSLLKLIRTKEESPALQAAVWELLTFSLIVQPSVLSLLFEIEGTPSCLIQGLRDAFEWGRMNVVAAAVGFFLDVWEGLSHTNAAHNMASRFRDESIFWPTLAQPLGVVSPGNKVRFAQGAIFKLLAIEYHVVARQAPSGGVLRDILSTFRDLYDQWLQDFTSVSVESAQATLPLYVLVSETQPHLYALTQWTTFMEIYFLEPPESKNSSSQPQQLRAGCDSPMLSATTMPTRPSNFTGDRTSVEWGIKLAEKMVVQAAAGQIDHVHTISRLCLCMIHHQVFEVVHKAQDPRWSTTLLRPHRDTSDTAMSIHLLTLVQSVLHHVEDASNVPLWTATLLLLRLLSQVKAQLPSLLISRLLSHSISALAADETFDVALMSLQEVLALTSSISADNQSTAAPHPSTFQMLAIISQSPLVPRLVDAWTKPKRRTMALRCLLSLVTTTSPQEIQSYVVDALTSLDLVAKTKALAKELTSLPTAARTSDDQTAWCLLLQIVTAILAHGNVSPLVFVAYVDPVLQSALYASDLTKELLEERYVIGHLLVQASRHLNQWQQIMPGSFANLLEAARAHLVPCSTWLQDTKDDEMTRRLWQVVHVIAVLLVKLTPSTKPQIQVGDSIQVDIEAARPIVDYIPPSAAHASVPCALGHLIKLAKSGLKQDEGRKVGNADEVALAVDALLLLIVNNYVLHENRYAHPSSRRIEMNKAVLELLSLAKSGRRNDVAYIIALEDLAGQVVLEEPRARNLKCQS